MADTDFLWSEEAGTLRRGPRGSLLLEAEALGRGLSTTRVGTRAFVAGTASEPHLLGFNGALSLETSRAAVRVGENRLMRKRHLADRDIPVPASKTFGFGEIEEAVDFAADLRRGVLIKPLLRDVGRLNRRAAKSPEAVQEEILRWRDKVPNSTRFLVEQRVVGPEHQFIIVGGRVVSVVRSRGRRWEGEIARPGVSGETVHPSLMDLAVRTMAAQPRAPHGVVRIIGGELTRSARRAVVVSSEPALMLVGPRRPVEWSQFIASEMIDHAARARPTELGRQPQAELRRSEDIAARVTLTELRDPQSAAEAASVWFAEHGTSLQLDSVSGAAVAGSVHAPPGLLAGFSGLAVARRISGERPQTVTIQQEGSRL